MMQNPGRHASDGRYHWLRRLSLCAIALAAALIFVGRATAAPAFAQTPPLPTTPAINQPLAVGCPNGGAPDVVLNVPNLSVEELKLEVDNLRARLVLDARLANLLQLTAGVDASTGKISLDIKGVKAELHLTVCLGTLEQIIDRTLTTIDRNPQILQQLLSSVNNLLSQTVNQLGQTVVRTVDATGNIVEQTLDPGGSILSQNIIGSVSDLPVVSSTTNALGQTVQQVMDASGAVIEVVRDASGNVLSTRVINQPLSVGR